MKAKNPDPNCIGDATLLRLGEPLQTAKERWVQLTQLQPLALPPLAAAQFLSISKRSLSRLIAAGKIVARKEGTRTLVDVESLKGYYERLPTKRSR